MRYNGTCYCQVCIPLLFSTRNMHVRVHTHACMHQRVYAYCAANAAPCPLPLTHASISVDEPL